MKPCKTPEDLYFSDNFETFSHPCILSHDPAIRNILIALADTTKGHPARPLVSKVGKFVNIMQRQRRQKPQSQTESTHYAVMEVLFRTCRYGKCSHQSFADMAMAQSIVI